MTARLIALALAAAVPLAASPPAAAQAQAGDAYSQLVGIFAGAGDNEAQLQAIVRQMGDAFLANDPALASLEARYPGLMDRVLVAMTPMVREHSQSATARFHAGFANLLRNNLTPMEARDAADFYGSLLGRRLLTTITANSRQDAIVAEAVAEGEAVQISEETVSADARRNTMNAVEALTDADRAEIVRRLSGKSWVAKFQTLMPQMIALRAAAENTPMDPALQSRMMTAIRAEVEAVAGSTRK